MTKEIQVISEEMEKQLTRTLADLTNLLVELDGSLKVIECGTHIEIRTAAGFVKYSRYANSSQMKLEVWQEMDTHEIAWKSYLETYNKDDES